MERATKVAIAGWACLAIGLLTWLVGGWRNLSTVSLSAFVVVFVLASFDRRTMAVVLALAYVFPALIRLAHGQYHLYFGIVWMSAFLAAMMPDALRTPWRVPVAWRGALVCWSLVIAVGATIVSLREIDLLPSLIRGLATPQSGLRAGSPLTMIWPLYVALVFLLGVLWFDWLWGTPAEEFHTTVVAPLAVSFLVMACVAVYQMLVDVTFLNETVFGRLQRASGTVYDANVCGMLAAMWIGAAAIGAYRSGAWRPLFLQGGLGMGWLAVWASGSRTALLVATVVTVASVASGLRVRTTIWSKAALVRWLLVACAVLGVFLFRGTNTVGPLQRVRASLPGFSKEHARVFATELWRRGNYGPAAAAMIREFPLVGVGPGAFNTLAASYAPGGLANPGDNAQNWFRHQFAELGAIGSLAWLAWVASFGWFLLQPRPHLPPDARIARSMLVAFALISLVGVPGQDLAVTITFWTIVFWCISLIGRPSSGATLAPASWLLVIVVVLAYGVGTLSVAATELRVPVRAARAGVPYSYGFYEVEPDGLGGEQRWAGRRAVVVLEAPRRWLALRVGVNHRDIRVQPVDVKIWRDRELVVDTRLTTTEPIVVHVPVGQDKPRFVLETWVSRVMHPRDFGVADDRDLGLLVNWTFVDRPPDEGRRGPIH